jgi:hypothetical protein
VPEPDISLHFLILVLKILNQVPNNLIQRLIPGSSRLPVRWLFSSKIIGLAPHFDVRAKLEAPDLATPLARVPVSDTVAITIKANLQKQA